MKAKKSPEPLRVGLISLGCAKNLVDAEIMLGALLKQGVEITNDAAQADVVIVNTCSFIDSAQEESVDTILESAEVREARNRGQGLIVAGCLPQRFREELPRLLPEVDAFMGIDQVEQVGEIVRRARERRVAKVGASGDEAQNPARETKLRKPEVGGKRATIVGRLAELEGPSGAGASPAGRRQPEKTRTVVTSAAGKIGSPQISGAALEAGPLVEVAARPHYIPDTPRRGFG